MNYPNYNPYANAYGGFGPGQGFPAAQQGPMFQNQGPQMPVQPGAVQAPAFTQPVSQPVSMQGNVGANGAIVCAPVTSREEAVATRVEAFGPSYIMPDFGHGMIYFKRFNDKTALADFEAYQRVQEPGSQEQRPQEEQSPAIDFAAIIGAIQGRFDTVERKVDALAERLDKPAPKTSTASKGGSRK